MSSPQQVLVDELFRVWAKHNRWPTFDYVAGFMEEKGFDAAAVLRSFPEWGDGEPTAGRYGDVVYEHSRPYPREDSEVSLSIRGLARHPLGEQAAQLFVATLRLAAERWRELPLNPAEVKSGQLNRTEAAALLRWPVDNLTFIGDLLCTEMPPGVRGINRTPETGDWTFNFDRQISRYGAVDVETYLHLAREQYEPEAGDVLRSLQDFGQPSSGADNVQLMQPSRAMEELHQLLEASRTPDVRKAGPAHNAWKAKVGAVMGRSLGVESSVLRDFRKVRYHIGIYSGDPGEAERDREYFASQVDSAAAYIEAAIYELELVGEPAEAPNAIEKVPTAGPAVVFLVHGHDEAAKHEVARFLHQALGSSPVILHEQANQGQTLVEKFERHAGEANFAVVLLTPDDVGRNKDDSVDQPRARQNVVFELGYFFGKLGRGRVAVLNAGVDKPSDVDGLVYISYPNSNWKIQLAKELQAATIPVDMDRLLD